MYKDTVYLLVCNDGGYIKDSVDNDWVERVQSMVSASMCTSFREIMALYCKSIKQGFEVNAVRCNVSFEILDTVELEGIVSKQDLMKTMIEYFSSDYFDSVFEVLGVLDSVCFRGYKVSKISDDYYMLEKVGA